MSRIPQNVVDQIYSAMDIVDIVGDYVQLKKKGANFWALSPFSNEKSPSFAVNPVKGIYKDFGASGKGGNAINFLIEMEGYTYVEALKHVAKRYGIEVPEVEESPEEKLTRDKRQSLFIVNEFAVKFFQEQLLESDEGKQIGLSYFKERGILDATIEEFQLGYAPDSWDTFAKAATKQQFNDDYLIELGLNSRSEKTKKLIDRFRGRVMFPILSPVGKVLGFGGRILSQRKDVGKYINSPESDIYHKSQVLYGLYQAKKAIRDEDLCIMTEGYMDTIALHQNGIKHVVASSGTALTIEQIRLIRRFTRNVLMIYDGDNAGIKAATRGIDLLLKEEMNAKVLILPDGHDPDSYVNDKGSQAFLDYVSNEALSFIDFKMRVLSEGKNVKDPVVQSEIVKGLADTLGYLPDRVQRQMFVKHVAQRMEISESLMTHAVEEALKAHNKLDMRDRRRRESATNYPPGMPPPPEVAEVKDLKAFEKLELANQEKELLRVLVNYPGEGFAEEDVALEDAAGNPIEVEKIPLMDFFVEELEDIVFENSHFENLKKLIFAEYSEQGNVDINRYLNHENDDIRKLVSDLLVPRHEISPGWRKHGAYVLDLDSDLRKTVQGPLFHYKSKKIDRLIHESREKVKEAQDQQAAEQLDYWLEINMHLLQMRREIHEKLGTEGAISAADGRL
ncbi:MAG: DNA primase [Bacteroidota bacterium]